MDASPLARTTRSGFPECIHRGSIAVVRNGTLLSGHGNPYVQLPMRSTAKPFILQPLIHHGAIEHYDLTQRHVAVMASSHNGEDVHIQAVKEILARIGRTEADLNCGTHPPYFDWIASPSNDTATTPLHHNCSGKHAGLLLLSHLMSFNADGYWMIDHPAQKLVLSDMASILKTRDDRIPLGTDGCGVPTYFVSLFALADAYHQLLVNPRLSRIKDAILQEPYMVAGKSRLETDIIRQCGCIAKSGSDGIFCLSLPDDDVGVAIKMESGSDDAVECVAAEFMNKMKYISKDDSSVFDQYRLRPIVTSTQLIVGRYEPLL